MNIDHADYQFVMSASLLCRGRNSTLQPVMQQLCHHPKDGERSPDSLEFIMFIRKSILSLALLGAMASPVFATSGTTRNDGELGASTHAMPTPVTREQVQRELAEWRKSPVSSGWREVGGQVGWVPERSLDGAIGQMRRSHYALSCQYSSDCYQNFRLADPGILVYKRSRE